MREKALVRIIEMTVRNFKNVSYGNIRYYNRSNVENSAEINQGDINGIYGANGSGKTAVIEALDILQHILSGESIPYSDYEGMFPDDKDMQMETVFFIETKERKFKVAYELRVRKNEEERRIQIQSECLRYWIRARTWKEKREIFFSNPFYNLDNVIGNEQAKVTSSNSKIVDEIRYFKSLQNLAVLCAQKNCSLFFNKQFIKALYSENSNEEEHRLSSIVRSLFDFAYTSFQVVKVNQLGDNYANKCIPINIHEESENEILQGCIPLLVSGSGEFPEDIYLRLVKIIEAINIALKAIIPNLKLKLHKISEEVNKDGIRVVQAKVSSVRDGKEFSTKYESAGIKRIISLLNYLISLYNDPAICLVVDELDAGIFEYLLGELIGELSEGAKGQLIFTSHNLRIMEKLDKRNIICSTINPFNRYISLTGIEKTHNRRDFYIRTLILGGQKERIYDDTDLQDIGYAFSKAGKAEDSQVNLGFSSEFLELLKENTLS